MTVVSIFRELMREKAHGPSFSFSELHLAKAIETIGTEGPTGRKRLSEKLRLGEGATRTLVTRLGEAHLIRVSRVGCELTDKGEAVFDEIRSGLIRISPVNSSPLTIGAYSVGVLVRGAANKVRQGIEQRDAAIKAGASGAAMLLYKGGKLIMPTISEDVARDYPSVAKQIMEIFQPKESYVIILGSANTRDRAEDGARAAAWTLIETED